MLQFATHTGFDGSDQDWQREFDMLTRECNSPLGIPLREFERLANDKSDEGCYCSDDELRSLLAKASVPKQAAPKPAAPKPAALMNSMPSSQPKPAPAHTPALHMPSQQSGIQPGSRAELIRSVFRALDRAGKGVLSSEEMLQFATHTGFDGSDQDWQSEFDMLTRECNSPQGIPLREFERLANDKSDDGCYCSDDELRSLLAKASVPKQAAPKPAAPMSSMPSSQPRPAPQPTPAPQPRPAEHVPSQQPNIQPDSRAELIRSVFRALDRTGRGVLSAEEMLQFATHTGFDGSDQDWQAEFGLLAKECNSPQGIPLREFERLANDKSDDGCYCSDDELRSLLAKVSIAHPTANAASETRRTLIHAVFVALNKNGLGMLSENEMRVFAVHAGFDGSDEEWRQEFQDLLASRDRDHGLSVLDFEHLVNDNSSTGCYCSDRMLCDLLAQEQSARGRFPAGVPNRPPPGLSHPVYE
ncbi:unnamed protein product [Effrenium voratum]|nr:unnamed protein product [Effrenium voratum]